MTVLHRNFNLIEGLLYRSPLRLMEAKSPTDMSWDLGFHHAKRGKHFDDSSAADADAYKVGYIAAKHEGKTKRAGGRSKKQQTSYDMGLDHGRYGGKRSPGGVTHQDHYTIGYDAGAAEADAKRAAAPPRAAQRGGHPVGGMGGVYPAEYSTGRAQLKDPEMWVSSQSMKRGLKATIARMTSAGKPVGEYIGQGENGIVHHGPQLADGTRTIYKFEKGDDEARLARHYLRNPELGRLRSLPKYLSVTNYGTTHDHSGKSISVIHAEHLDDVEDQPALNHILWLAHSVSRIGRGVQDAEEESDPEFSGMTREEIALVAYQAIDKVDAAAQQEISDEAAYAQVKRFADDLRSMAKMGIFPCDLVEANLGLRRATGEIVMRDAGCYGLA